MLQELNQNQHFPSPTNRFPPFNNALSEDEVVVKKFIDTIQSKFDNNIIKSPSKKERELMYDSIVNPGLFIGTCVGISSFLFFRKAPAFVLNRILASKKTDFTAKRNLVKPQRLSILQERPCLYKEGTVVRPISIFFDIIMSVGTGLCAWILTSDRKKMLTCVADLPLVEGHSVVAEGLCHDFTDLYKNKVSPKFWKENSDDTVKAIERFVSNCKKRSRYEDRIRRETGLRSVDRVFLPETVPKNILQLEAVEDFEDTDWAALEDVDEEENDSPRVFWSADS